MARAYGSSAGLLLKRETTYGTRATGNYVKMPFTSCNLGSEQGLIDDPVLGLGRDPAQPLLDVINDDGDISVPVDPRYLGLWLTGIFGNPDTDPAAAEGYIDFSINPSAGNTITINGVEFTFVADDPGSDEIEIAGTVIQTVDAIVTALNGSSDDDVNDATYSREWSAGVERALRSYADEATDMAAQVEQVTSNALRNLEDVLVEFTMTGKFEWKDMVNSMLSDIARLIVRTQITGPLAQSLGSIFGSFFGSADGNVFSSGRPVRGFAKGTVVFEPTLFPMANGTGLMGEAGPEAIMPLRRLPSGRLGVESSGNGSSYTVNVDARGSSDPAATAKQVEDAVDRALAARIPGIVRTSTAAAKTQVIDQWQRRGGRFD